MPGNSWILLGRETIRDFRILRIREDKYRFAPTGAEVGFAVCDSADWVLVIPITVDNEVVFVRQFRHGIGEVVLEIPGGVMEPDERPAETAARELQEETGYAAQKIEVYGPLLPNPALNTARCHIAVATGCARTGPPTPDPLERIEIELRPVTAVREMIHSGELQHALCIAAFAITGTHWM